MALTVTTIKQDGHKAKVTVKSDLKHFPTAIQELQGPAAKSMAVKHAQLNGVPDPRCELSRLSPYPVDAAGNIVYDTVVRGPDGHPIPGAEPLKIDHYEIDVPITARLV